MRKDYLGSHNENPLLRSLDLDSFGVDICAKFVPFLPSFSSGPPQTWLFRKSNALSIMTEV